MSLCKTYFIIISIIIIVGEMQPEHVHEIYPWKKLHYILI